MTQSAKRSALWAVALIGMGLTLAGCDRGALLGAKDEASNLVAADPAETAMQTAVKEARETLPHILHQMKNPKDGQRSFTIKVALPTPEGSLEHIWVSELKRVDDTIIGNLSNEPFNLQGDLKKGDPVSFTRADVTDWGYLDGERLRGHFTTRYLATQMTPEEATEVLNMMHDTPLPRAPLRPRFAG
ncbi:MAG: DUF2314 domain-containing protein [Pseudomonadota bacterium]